MKQATKITMVNGSVIEFTGEGSEEFNGCSGDYVDIWHDEQASLDNQPNEMPHASK